MQVLCIAPNLSDATSFYRAVGPLAALKKQYDIQLIYEQKPEWMHMKHTDVLFLQRPVSNQAIQAAELARSCNVPVWIDYDDNLLEVPVENSTYDFHKLQEVQMALIYLLGIADRITVSTPYLAERFKTYNKDIIVVPNAWDNFQYPLRDRKYQTPNKVILWRGSNTHHYDLGEEIPAILEISDKYPDYKWVFIGYRHPELSKRMVDRATFIPMMHLLPYFEQIQRIRPQIQIVPLHDNVFNRCKSNIAWLEGHSAGATVVAPDWDEWKHTEFRYSSFAESLNSAIEKTDSYRETLWSESRKVISDKFLLSEVNEERIEMLLELVR